MTVSDKVVPSAAADDDDDLWDEEGFEHMDMDFELWGDQKPFQRAKDKVIFFLGTMNVIIMAFVSGGFPFLMPWYYTLKTPILCTLRFFVYRKEGWHYFLMDFCYWGNALLLVYIWAFPGSSELFAIVFSAANGPLAWAVILFGNSLVFHSVDKMTSALIHISPPIVTYCLRWYPPANNQHGLNFWWEVDGEPRFKTCLNPVDDDCNSDMIFSWAWPSVFFASWMVLYTIVIQGICGRRIRRNPNALTTYRYLFRKKRGLGWRLIGCMGAKYRIWVYGVLYVIFASIMMLPTIAFYRYQWLHFLLIMVIVAWAIKNAGSFYIEVFSRRYTGVEHGTA